MRNKSGQGAHAKFFMRAHSHRAHANTRHASRRPTTNTTVSYVMLNKKKHKSKALACHKPTTDRQWRSSKTDAAIRVAGHVERGGRLGAQHAIAIASRAHVAERVRSYGVLGGGAARAAGLWFSFVRTFVPLVRCGMTHARLRSTGINYICDAMRYVSYSLTHTCHHY